MLFKLPNLNSNLALTLGYLNPALNNSALDIRIQEILACGIWNPGKILLAAYGILGFGIGKTAWGIWNPTNNWNPQSKFHRQKIRNPLCGIQNPGLSWIPLHGVKNSSRPFFEQKVQGLFKDTFPIFKDSIQCKKEPWVYVFISSSTTWVISSRRSFCVCSFFFQLRGQHWNSRTFKVHANPGLKFRQHAR